MALIDKLAALLEGRCTWSNNDCSFYWKTSFSLQKITNSWSAGRFLLRAQNAQTGNQEGRKKKRKGKENQNHRNRKWMSWHCRSTLQRQSRKALRAFLRSSIGYESEHSSDVLWLFFQLSIQDYCQKSSLQREPVQNIRMKSQGECEVLWKKQTSRTTIFFHRCPHGTHRSVTPKRSLSDRS